MLSARTLNFGKQKKNMSPTLRPVVRRLRNTQLRVVQINSKRTNGRLDSYWTITPLKNEFGKRYRPHFSSKAEAEAERGRRERELRLVGVEGSQMSTALRMDAIQARHLLAPHKISLTAAAKHYLNHLEKTAKKAPLVSEAVEMYLKFGRGRVGKGELREVSLRNMRSRLGSFCNGIEEQKDVPPMGQHKISDVGLPEIYEFLNSLPYKSQTKAHYRAQIHSLFEFSRQKGWTEGNPVGQLAREKRAPRGAVSVLSVEEAEELLEHAQKSSHSRVLVPRLVLGLFIGLRPSETRRLDWADVDFNLRNVQVFNNNKTKTERFVEMNPTAYAWLKKYRGVGKVENLSEGRSRRAWDKLRKSVGWNLTRTPADKGDWVGDILRHSYGSYMLAVTGDDRYKVCALMGNSIPILNKHYRRPMPRQLAEPYWKILPDESPLPKKLPQKA